MATLVIVVANVAFSLWGFSNTRAFYRFVFNPVAMRQNNQWDRLITSGFLHANVPHLLINMFVLYQFGSIVERYYQRTFGENGLSMFVLMYVGALVVSEIPSYLKHKANPNFNSVGASGAVAAVLFAFILYDPWNILLLFFIIPMPAVVLGIGYLWYSAVMARREGQNINHDAHFWGAVFGFVFSIAMEPRLLTRFFSQLMNGPNFGGF
jgi:membrane associated rhomboid family serine protease